MRVADAIQDTLDAQRRRDLVQIARWRERRPNFGALIPCTTVTCDRAQFWRDRYDQAMDEIEDLRAQMAARGITPQRRTA